MEYAVTPEIDFKIQDILNGSISLQKVISSIIFKTLGISAFFIQFLITFQNEFKLKRIENLSSPKIFTETLIETNTCPVCLQDINMPTVVQVSGIVYCFKCIVSHFKNKGKYCPVSFYLASTEDLITLFEENI